MGDSAFQKPITGTFTGAAQSVDLTSPNQTIEVIQLSGTWVGTLVVEGSNDGTTYYSVPAVENSTNLPVATITANGAFIAITNGYQFVRIRSSAWSSGTATLNVYGSDAATLTRSINLISGGTDGTIIGNDFGVSSAAFRTAAQIGNATGVADFNSGNSSAQTLRVVVATNQVALPVSQSGVWSTGRTWTLASGTDSIASAQSGTWNIGTLTSITNPVAVTQSTSPWVVSGTVTTNQGTSPWITKDAADGTIGSAIPGTATQIAGKNVSGNLQAVTLGRDGQLNVSIGADKSVFGPLIVASRVQQLFADFSETLSNNNITQAVTGTGVVSLASANASISTGTGTTSSAQIVSIGSIDYLPGREMYAQYTAAFTTPTSAASTQLTGLYNGTDGLVIGFNGLNFSIATIAAGVSTFVSSASFNVDTLAGAATSLFTRAGIPEAVNFTFKNVYRIRAGWLGAAPIFFEIMSPDGNWVTFHIVRQPNVSLNPSFLEPSLPITMLVTKTASDATNLKITTTSWDAGVVDTSGQTDTSDSGTITALNGTVTITSNSQSTIVANVTGTWTGTIQVQGDVGDGTWNPIYAIDTNAVAAQTITTNATLIIACAGFDSVRLIGTSWSSGTANINWVASSGTQAIIAQVVGNIASGSQDFGNPIKMGGVYNATPPTVNTGSRVDLQLDQNGKLLVSSQNIPTTASKFSIGQLNTNTSVAYLAVEFTAYTEPATNSAMTIVSASANDTSAGTGARTVTVTYLDQTGAGPFTTTFTTNGTTPVTAGVSNMCFVEKIIVSTVGSTGSNVGILTLKTGGGATIGTIAATNNQTFWAHHYVPLSKTCYISGFSFGNNATANGNGAQFILKASTPTIANTPEIQVSDVLGLAGVSTSSTRNYLSPIQVMGPARVRAYVLPYANAATTQFASFDFIDN